MTRQIAGTTADADGDVLQGDIGCPGVSRRGQSLQGADLQSAEVELTLRSIPSKNCHHIA